VKLRGLHSSCMKEGHCGFWQVACKFVLLVHQAEAYCTNTSTKTTSCEIHSATCRPTLKDPHQPIHQVNGLLKASYILIDSGSLRSIMRKLKGKRRLKALASHFFKFANYLVMYL